MPPTPGPASCRIDVSRVRNLRPRPVGAGAPTALDLRGAVVRATALISPRRRVAAVVPLVMALLAWFAIPGEAADFQLDSAGDRYGTISHGIGGHGSYPIHIPGYNHEDAGMLLMHEVGGGDVEAYCIDLRGVRNPSAVFTSGERRIDQIAFILNHHFPAVRGPGELGDLNQEAAAVQLAVWTFSDGVNLDTVTAPSVPGFPAVVQRARQIAAEASSQWGAWSRQQTAQPVVALSFGAPVPAPGQVPLTASVSGGPTGSVPDGAPVVFTVTSPAGTVEGQRTVTRPLSGGSATVQVQAAAPGEVTVSARVTMNGLAYQQLNPNVRPNQTLILASQLPVSGETSQTVTLPGAPRLTLSKSVDTGGPPATSIEARPGDRLRYTVSYANAGTATAPAVIVRDDLSQGELGRLRIADVVLEGPGSSLDAKGRTAVWQIGDVPPGGTGSVSVLARVPSSLRDSGTGVDLCDVASSSAGTSPPVSSNAACAHVTTTPHLATVKVVDSASAAPGQTLRYTITVRNDGSRDLEQVTVTDVLRGQNLDLLTNVRPDDGGGFDEASRTVTWTIAALAGGQSTAVGFTADLPPAGVPEGACLVNVAHASVGTGVVQPSAPVTTCVHSPSAPVASPPPGPTAITGTPIAVPRTGVGHAMVRSTVTGACLMTSGGIVMTGLRRRRWTAWRPPPG